MATAWIYVALFAVRHEMSKERTVDRVDSKEHTTECCRLPLLSTDAAALSNENNQGAYECMQRQVYSMVAAWLQLVRMEIQLQCRHSNWPPRGMGTWVIQRGTPKVVEEKCCPWSRWAQVLVLDHEGAVVVEQPATQPSPTSRCS